MKFSILDPNVGLPMNVFLVIANVINLIQNLPQVYKTYKVKSTKDFSGWFLLLRGVGNAIWCGYAVEVNSLLMLINGCVTIISTSFIGYYKIVELYDDYRNSKYKQLNNQDHQMDHHIIDLETNNK